MPGLNKGSNHPLDNGPGSGAEERAAPSPCGGGAGWGSGGDAQAWSTSAHGPR